ncbi:MAG: hypothetical protein WC809_15860 [Sinimarinibacterium sp.]|jgi:hypothetical protein
MSRDASPAPRRAMGFAFAVAFAVALVTAVFAVQLPTSIPRLVDAELRNPDSYYKLVLLGGRAAGQEYSFVARDNVPDGNWVHWSKLHSATLWQLHRLWRLAGVDEKSALRYAGGALTFASMLALALFVALAVARVGTPRAVVVTALVLVSSASLRNYGYIIQITHHIFMLVPLAAAAACLLQRPGARSPLSDLCGGLLLGLSLWVSPETMPFVVGLAGVRTALRLQYPESAPLWPLAIGLVITTALGWRIDPPPPGFTRWALDHISLAYVVLAGVLAAVLLVADVCAQQRLRLSRSLPAVAAAALAAAGLWMLAVPGALAGPVGLVPEELRSLFWDRILELQPARKPAQWVGYVLIPVCAAVVAAVAAWYRRSLWLAAMAAMALAYGALAAWHIRMGAIGAVAAALAWAAGAATLRGMDAANDDRLSRRELAATLLVALLPCVLMVVQVALYRIDPPDSAQTDSPRCSLRPVEAALNRLPPATVLAPLSNGPELLYRTHHRIVAGPYHHNVGGMLDSYHAWMDSGDDRAEEVVRRRGVEYVLGCVAIQRALRGRAGARTLAQRVMDGDVPAWLEPMDWPAGTETGWRLYRVLPDTPSETDDDVERGRRRD